MTPSDDEILVAVRANVPEHCCMWDAENKLIDAWGLDRDEMLRLYRAAYAAGMEAAAGMCQQIADGHTQAAIDSHRADDMLMYEDRGIGASECVVAIRAANGEKGKA